MNEGVVFVGLYRQDWNDKDFSELKSFGDVWSCQDWYAKCKKVWYPDLVFQVHSSANDLSAYNDVDRFPGDWRAEYDKCGGVWSSVPLDGIKNNIVVSFDECEKDMGAGYFASTISYMFYWAIKKRYKKIWLLGCKFRSDGEHENQIYGMWKNMEDARRRGIEVINPHEAYWLKHLCDNLRSAKALDVPYGKESSGMRASCGGGVPVDKLKVTI